jgi:hypothetical protein
MGNQEPTLWQQSEDRTFQTFFAVEKRHPKLSAVQSRLSLHLDSEAKRSYRGWACRVMRAAHEPSFRGAYVFLAICADRCARAGAMQEGIVGYCRLMSLKGAEKCLPSQPRPNDKQCEMANRR